MTEALLREFSARSKTPTARKQKAELADGFDEERFDFRPRKKRHTQRSSTSPPSPFGPPMKNGSLEAGRRTNGSPTTRPFRKQQSEKRSSPQKQSSVASTSDGNGNQSFRYDPSQDPYEGGTVSRDESLLRLKDMFQVKRLWRDSMMHPGRSFDDVMVHMKQLSLWHFLYASLAGGKAMKDIQSSRRRKLRHEEDMRNLRYAVISGRFRWRGKAGIFIQGEMRPGMELRIVRSDKKDMEEFIEAQKRKKRPMPFDQERKQMLDSFFQDRLVAEMIRVVLEPIFEPTFVDSSHGFRPGRTQHTALKYVRREFNDATWIYRSDLRGLFELILDNRSKFTDTLLGLIEQRVKDKAFLDLLLSGLETRTLLSDYEINPPEEGYSPLNIKSGFVSLLCNIYFDPLDQWIRQKNQELHEGKYKRVNAEKAAVMIRGVDERVANALLPLDPSDPVFRKLSYCRFADDFVFGVAGPRDLALELKEEFRAYVRDHLHFPLPAVKMNSSWTKTLFLGHTLRRKEIVPRKPSIKNSNANHKWISADQSGRHGLKNGTVSVMGRQLVPRKVGSKHAREILSIEGEADKMVRLLARAGYCHKDGNPVPNFKHTHFTQSETNLIIRRMLLSICDFYRVARNRQRLVCFCSYILRHSLAKLYASKFKLRSRSQVFKRGGSHLSNRIKQGKGYYGKIDPVTGQSMEEYPELPYARLREVPKPDLLPLPPKWQPEMIHILQEKLLGDMPLF